MDRHYWEKIAPDYNEEIFDVFFHDKKSIIRNAIDSVASPHKTVMDAGCAIGKWLPFLSEKFRKVYAADISSKNLSIAQNINAGFANIEYLRMDFSGRPTRLPKSDVSVCINAILTDSMTKRDRFFKNLSRSLKKGGTLVLVVPSAESWLFSHIVQQKWKIDNILHKTAVSGKEAIRKYDNMRQGNLDIDNVPTKHYVEEELHLLLEKEGIKVSEIRKIEYEWTTEFVHPPKWLKQPKPWDWMCVGNKI